MYLVQHIFAYSPVGLRPSCGRLKSMYIKFVLHSEMVGRKRMILHARRVRKVFALRSKSHICFFISSFEMSYSIHAGNHTRELTSREYLLHRSKFRRSGYGSARSSRHYSRSSGTARCSPAFSTDLSSKANDFRSIRNA